MSVKQQLAAAVEALPESATLEEASERVYAAFKLEQERGGPGGPKRWRALAGDPLATLRGQVEETGDIASPVSAAQEWAASFRVFLRRGPLGEVELERIRGTDRDLDTMERGGP